MKRIIFVTSIEDWQHMVTSSLANWEDYVECVTYCETENAIQNNEEDILTTSMTHFSLNLIDYGYDIYLYQNGKLKKITLGRKLKNNDIITNTHNLLYLYQNDLI
jgi:hypothetical protein